MTRRQTGSLCCSHTSVASSSLWRYYIWLKLALITFMPAFATAVGKYLFSLPKIYAIFYWKAQKNKKALKLNKRI